MQEWNNLRFAGRLAESAMLIYRLYKLTDTALNDIAQKKPRTLKDFQLEEIDGEVLLYSPKATRSIYMNPSASLIWHLCTGDFTTQEIIETLQEQFPDNAESIAEDVTSTITQFLESEAIELI